MASQALASFSVSCWARVRVLSRWFAGCPLGQASQCSCAPPPQSPCLILGLSVSSAVVWPLLSHIGFTQSPDPSHHEPHDTNCGGTVPGLQFWGNVWSLWYHDPKQSQMTPCICRSLRRLLTHTDSRNPASYFSLSSVTSLGFLLSASPFSSLTHCWRQVRSSRLIWLSRVSLADLESWLFWISLKSKRLCQAFLM